MSEIIADVLGCTIGGPDGRTPLFDVVVGDMKVGLDGPRAEEMLKPFPEAYEKLKVMQMDLLREELEKASDDYYNGTESMSNFEYDEKFDALKELEEMYGSSSQSKFKDEKAFTDSVGASVGELSPLPKVTHEYEAKSLGKTKSVSELKAAQAKTADGENGKCCLMWKLDGMTGQLTYENGKLVLAASRGDGIVGQDMTKNSPYIEGIPQEISLKSKLVVRGEILMTYAEFDRLNSTGKFANARNLAASTATAQDTNLPKERHTVFKAFELVHMDDKSACPKTFGARLDYLATLGFGVVDHEIVVIKDLDAAIARWSTEDNIASIGFPVDGLVVSNENVKAVEKLPDTGHHPSTTKSMAFKWADETADTTIREVEWSPSRTGLLNPVAIFDTVDLCGTKVSRASIHNVSIIRGLNIKLGDRVQVYKANMIIPQIAKNLDKAKAGTDVSSVTVVCPCCGTTAVVKDNDGTLTMVCPNAGCTAKKLGAFDHFVSKPGMNIEGLSEKTLETMLAQKIITTFADLYTLGDAQAKAFADIPGFGPKAYANLLESIKKSKTTDSSHFLYACGIDGIGRGQLKEIIGFVKNNYDTLEKYHSEDGSYDLLGLLVNMAEDGFDFTAINGIGEVLAKNLSSFLLDHYGEYADVLPYLTFKDAPAAKSSGSASGGVSLVGKTYVITGKLDNFGNRDELVAFIESFGGKVSGSISSNTTALINNDVNSTSSKNKKAKALGVPIISEADFLAFVKGGSGSDSDDTLGEDDADLPPTEYIDESFFKTFHGFNNAYSKFKIVGMSARGLLSVIDELIGGGVLSTDSSVGDVEEAPDSVSFVIPGEMPTLAKDISLAARGHVVFGDTAWDEYYLEVYKDGEPYDNYTAVWEDGSPYDRSQDYVGDAAWDAFVKVVDNESGVMFNTGAGAVDMGVLQYYRDIVKTHTRR